MKWWKLALVVTLVGAAVLLLAGRDDIARIQRMRKMKPAHGLRLGFPAGLSRRAGATAAHAFGRIIRFVTNVIAIHDASVMSRCG